MPHLSMVSCFRNSLAVKRSTFLTNTWARFPAFSKTSSSAQVTPGSTGGIFSSTSGGNQLKGSGSAAAPLVDRDNSSAGSALAALRPRSEEHTSELQSPCNLVCRLLLEKKNTTALHPQ